MIEDSSTNSKFGTNYMKLGEAIEMLRKTVSGITLTLLLIGMLTLAFNVQPVKAGGAIYIRANGSVDPPTAPILRNGDLYTLTGNITSDSDGIVIERDNIILDGAGYTLQGPGGWVGIYFWARNNVTIKDFEIKQFWYGIDFGYSTNICISGNDITTNAGGSIQIMACSNSAIVGNSITGNGGYGIWFGDFSKYNSISGNTLASNWAGIGIFSSSYNGISGNNMTESYGYGIELVDSAYNSIIGNSVIGSYWHGVWLSSSSDNILCGNNIANNDCGIYLDNSLSNTIYHNNFVNNAQQTYSYNSLNIWDDGYPSGGNYWSDYIGVDSNNDSIGDTPYVIDADNIDRYPHMSAWASTVYLSPSTITTEADTTFNVSIMASRIQNLWSWQAGIQWDPATLEYESYTWGEFQTSAWGSKSNAPTINEATGKTSKPALESALRGWFAPVTAAEIRLLTITFKVLTSGTSSLKLVDVSLKGQNSTATTVYPRWSDVNNDGVVDTEDVTLTYICWEEGCYNQTVDFNDDDIVDITDISIVTSDFGKSDTDPEWGATTTVCDISTATVGVQVHARPSQAYIVVPHHSQIKGYYCGPAALEMIFDFYGPDVSQVQIADAARTSWSGTYTCDMIRAAHFSNISTSMGKESPLNFTGYTARKVGYAAFERWGMTIGDLKSLIAAGYPVIVLTTWHFRVAVGYSSTHITFQDPLWGPMYNMTYSVFSSDWDYSNHWGLFVSPWKVKISNARNVLPGEVFNVTATITYPWASPFPKDQYPASAANATITLPVGLTLVEGETPKKTIGTSYLEAGDSVNVTWTVQAQSLGGYAISVEAEGKVAGFVPPIPSGYPEYGYEDRIGGSSQSVVAVTSRLDESPPTTIDHYDGLWHNYDFSLNLTAGDDNSGIMETYYKINDGPVKTLGLDGQPYITTSSVNNTLEYWSVDWAGNEEFPHKFLFEIKLDKTNPTIGSPLRTPSGDVQPGQEVKVAVNATDTVSGVKNVTLFYTVTDGAIWETLSMNPDVSTGLYETTIPGQPDRTRVKFKIVAYDQAGNKAVEDNFGKYYVYEALFIYELTIITTPGGTTNPAPDTHLYKSGKAVSVTAIPDSGYVLDYWELDGVNVGSENPHTMLMDRNQTLKAIFLSARADDVAVVSVVPSDTAVYIGQVVDITVTVRNEGNFAETFEVMCKYELEGTEHVIGVATVNLAPQANTSIVFNLTTTDITVHTIKAEIPPLTGETDTADNTLTSPTTVKVKMIGDVNGDNRIDMRDIYQAALAFGSYPSHPRWNPQVDITQDNKVDMRDLVLIARNFGKTHP